MVENSKSHLFVFVSLILNIGNKDLPSNHTASHQFFSTIAFDVSRNVLCNKSAQEITSSSFTHSISDNHFLPFPLILLEYSQNLNSVHFNLSVNSPLATIASNHQIGSGFLLKAPIMRLNLNAYSFACSSDIHSHKARSSAKKSTSCSGTFIQEAAAEETALAKFDFAFFTDSLKTSSHSFNKSSAISRDVFAESIHTDVSFISLFNEISLFLISIISPHTSLY
jgi:hypothetical protein